MPSSPPCAQATGTRCACSVVRGIVAMECLAKSMQLRDAVLWCFVFVYLKNRRWEYISACGGKWWEYASALAGGRGERARVYYEQLHIKGLGWGQSECGRTKLAVTPTARLDVLARPLAMRSCAPLVPGERIARFADIPHTCCLFPFFHLSHTLGSSAHACVAER